MKKTLLFAAGLLTLGSVKAQTYFTDDFATGGIAANEAWTSETSDVLFDWVSSDLGSPGNFYARMFQLLICLSIYMNFEIRFTKLKYQ